MPTGILSFLLKLMGMLPKFQLLSMIFAVGFGVNDFAMGLVSSPVFAERKIGHKRITESYLIFFYRC